MASTHTGDASPSLARVERLLALLLLDGMADESQTRRVQALSMVGFANSEIADLLQTTPAVVAQRLYEARGSKSKASGNRVATRVRAAAKNASKR